MNRINFALYVLTLFLPGTSLKMINFKTSDKGRRKVGLVEYYTGGENSWHNRIMRRRTAESHAAFFLLHLGSGMSLIDCGCGPGAITPGLAETVRPGRVVGVDISESDIQKARALFEHQGV